MRSANFSRESTSSSSARSTGLVKSMIRPSRAAARTPGGGPPHRKAEMTVLVSATTRTIGASRSDLGVDLGLAQWRFETGELTHRVKQPIHLALFGFYAQKLHKIFH